MIFHSELPKEKRIGGLELAVYDLTKALNRYTLLTHARLGDHIPQTLKGVQAFHFHGLWNQDHISLAQSCHMQGIPYIVSPHGMLEPWALKNKYIKKWIHRQLFTNDYLRKATCILTTSRIEKINTVSLFPNSRVECIPLGLRALPDCNHENSREKLDIDNEVFQLLYLSRIDEKKNLLLLIEALRRVKEQTDRKIQLVIIGDGEGKYHRRCIEVANGIRDRKCSISFKGPIWSDDKWDWIASADLFCLPSSSENFGYAYLESLSVGTPILATPNTPWADHSFEPFTYIVETNSESISTGILSALSHTYTERDRNATIQLVKENYLWDKLIKDYSSLYSDFETDEN